MILIQVKFLGATEHRGSRYKATIADGSGWSRSASVESSYKSDEGDIYRAAEALCSKLASGPLPWFQHKDPKLKIVGSFKNEAYLTWL